MIKSVIKLGIAAAAASFISIVPLSQQAHAIYRGVPTADGLTCRVMLGRPHFHIGISAFERDLVEAQRAAVIRWVKFTVWEYGHAYGDYRIAKDQSLNCRPSVLRRGGWNCIYKARPCRF